MKLDDLCNHVELVLKRASSREELISVLGKQNAFVSDARNANIERLRSPRSVAVTATIYPALFGGPLSQLIKCFAASKICEELRRRSIEAIPVCLISSNDPSQFAKWSITIADSGGDLHTIEVAPSETLSTHEIRAAIHRIDVMGNGQFDASVLQLVEDAFADKTSLNAANARLFERLMSEQGFIAIDLSLPGFCPINSELLPELAYIADDHAIEQNRLGLAWPLPSATIVDAQSRRAIEKYGLSIQQLYAGEEQVMKALIDAMPLHISDKLGRMKYEANEKIALLQEILSSQKKSAKDVEDFRHKITYQLDKLRTQFDAAAALKEKTARRQVRRACNFLAPNGAPQQNELAWMQIPLKRSLEVLSLLQERLDVFTCDHQLISMD